MRAERPCAPLQFIGAPMQFMRRWARFIATRWSTR